MSSSSRDSRPRRSYQNLLRRGRDERWIDVYETEGKRSGAYSTGVYDTHPYVLLNYQETTNEIFTIAHEMGHSIHTYKSTSRQPYPKSEYTIFLAEIASTVNEVLLMKYLYSTTEDKNLKKYLLNYYIDMIRTTLFRQTQFAEFEQIAHAKAEAGEPLTKENLCEVYYKLNKEYYGAGSFTMRKLLTNGRGFRTSIVPSTSTNIPRELFPPFPSSNGFCRREIKPSRITLSSFREAIAPTPSPFSKGGSGPHLEGAV